jgi:2',3'-cyclic-nucleotide 2'-phosphodiesterase
MKVLFVGDVVGAPGRRTLATLLPDLREHHAPDFVVVNGENAAGGVGITSKVAEAIFDLGVDAITLGNHTYRHAEVYEYLDTRPEIVRPANFLRSQPGHGSCVVERDGVRLGVVNLLGNLFMNAARPAFAEADAVLHALAERADHVIVDMHAEATSEKVGMGWYLDGRVTAVLGTHTHIPTADARVLPGGTAYITDVGMTGPRGGILGVRRDLALKALVTHMPTRFETSEEDSWLNAVLVDAATPGRADSIDQLLVPAPAPA